MKEAIEKKLQSMLNKSYKYGMRIVTFTAFRFNEEKEKVYLSTNEKVDHWERPYDSVLTFLKEFAPAEAPAAQSTSSEIVVSNTSNIVDSLRGILLDNIKKVQENKEYIPQATAINNNVNSIINLSKLQMDALRMQEKIKH